MQILVSAVSTGLQQEEKYQSIPRDRWGKWRQNLREKANDKASPGSNHSPDKAKKPLNSRQFSAPALNFLPEPDLQASTLFNATLLRSR